MARPLSWLVVAGLAGAALVGPGVAGAAASPSDDSLPNSGHTSSGGLTLDMGTATMACDANNSVGSISGTFTFSGTGHVVIYLVPNNGSDASPVAHVEDNETTIDLAGKTSPAPFTITITSPFTTSKGGVLAVFAKGDNGDLYNAKSNSLNCTETTTTSSSSESTTSTVDTTSSVESTTSTVDTTSSVASTTSTVDTTSSVASTTSTVDTTSSVASTTSTVDTTSSVESTTSSVASTSSSTTDPSGEVEGVQGTPRVTLPPTSTLDAATPAGSPDGIRIALLGLAILLASILLLQPKGSRSRK